MFYNLLIFAGGAERGIAAGKRTHNKPEKMKKGAMRVALQAIIMAGGEGVRLRPLTDERPKPLVPLLGEPCVGYALTLLRRYGIGRIGATLWYRPEEIRKALGGGERWGAALRYYEESVPCGTAGSVRMAMEELKDSFFVLSGDGLTDVDLSAAMAFHREKDALATLVLKRVGVPLAYGVVVTEGDGRITRFVEKPGWKGVVSDLVNTGVYILEPEIFRHIPAEGAPDFGRDIFPALAAEGLPLYGYETDAYWCDIGDQRAYLQAQRDLLAGRVNLPHPAGIDPGARMDAAAAAEGCCWVGPGAVIGPGARIIDAVIGPGARVEKGALVRDSCLWAGARAGEKARVEGSVLCDGAAAGRGAELSDGCALGPGAVAGAGARLRPGVKVGPHLQAPPGAVTARSIWTAEAAEPQWCAWGAACGGAESACALCGAYAQVTGARRVICGGEDAALRALAEGALAAAGARVLSAGDAPWPMVQSLIRTLRLDGGVWAGQDALRFADGEGRMLTPRQQSAVSACMRRRGMPPGVDGTGSVKPLAGAEEIYLASLLPPADSRPLTAPVAVFCDRERLLELAAEALGRMQVLHLRTGAAAAASAAAGETGFLLSPDGEEITVLLENRALSREMTELLLLSLCLKRTGKLYDLPAQPRAAGRLAPLCPPDGSPACARQRWLTQDALAALAALCAAMKDAPLAALLAELPETHVFARACPVPAEEKGRVVRELYRDAEPPYTLGEGVCFSHSRGWATVAPDAYRSAVRVTAEAADTETARELCDLYLERIRALTDGKNMAKAEKNIPFSP